LLLNGFEIDLPNEVEIVTRPLPDSADVKEERERLTGHWFVHWAGGQLYCMRLRPGGPNVQGDRRSWPQRDCIWLLRARVDDVVESVFERYQALRYRPFTILAQRDEVVRAAATVADVGHPLLDGFTIHPKLTLQAKVLEPRDGDVRLGLFVEVGMRYQVDADMEALNRAGIDLPGLYAVRRHPAPGERRLAGRIDRIDGDLVHLTEATGDESVASSDLALEGSLETFSRCLGHLLGSRHDRFTKAVDEVVAGFRVGPGYDKIVRDIGTFLARRSPITLGVGLKANVGTRLAIENTLGITSIYTAHPVEYVFDRSGSNRHRFAWSGLRDHGPYDRATFANKSPRIAVLYPDVAEGKVETFVRSLRDGIPPPEKGFSGGFARLFGLANPQFVPCPVGLARSGPVRVEGLYREAAERFLERGAIDAAIIVVLDEHADLPGLGNPYLRTKAFFLTLGIPTQEIRLRTATKRPADLQWTLQNFSVALYAKLNGTPWTVDQDKAISDEIIVGMGMAELSGSRAEKRQRFVGITTVFSGDGTYLLGSASRECSFEEYPATLRASMAAVLADVKQRNGWQPDDTVRVIFHAHKPLKRDEVAAIAFDGARAVGAEQRLQLAFLTISHDHPFYLFDPDEPGVPARKGGSAMKGALAPSRGTIARIGRWTRLVCVNSHHLIKRPNSPHPKPLLVNLHQDSTFHDLEYLSEQVLKFTSLSWRSILPARTPVTIHYSELMASLLARLRQVPDWSPTALGVKLRWSRWFL